ncbi:MarR family transcriptional regulator [Sphingobium sp. LSP13-1-1.1]|uniref:MarR family transcriptional regulator n=1 Tax=Sphingobium sp. LSP13-1-1.1 TaxID=3135234 RepID=UPI00342D5034
MGSAAASRPDAQTVGSVAQQLALESSTLTPLLKRLEAAGPVRRTRNPVNERQVVIALTKEGDALRFRAGCLGDTLLEASGQTPAALAKLNGEINELRNAVYRHSGGWAVSETPAEAD